MKHKNLPEIFLFSFVATAMLACFVLAYYPRSARSPSRSNLSAVAVLEDTDGTITVDAIQSMSGDFAPQESSTVFRNRSTSAFWIRFTVDGSAHADEFRYLELACPNMEEIEVYFEGKPVIHAGKKVDIREVPIKSMSWYIPVPVDQDPVSPVYVRVHTATIISIPMRVISASEMMEKSGISMVLFGIMFGTLLAVLIVNLFSYIILRRQIFITYTLYLFFLILYHFRVHGFMYLIPTSFRFRETVLWISLSGFGIFMMVFAKQFMNLKRRLPVINTVFNTLIAAFIVQGLLGVFVSRYLANTIAYITGFIVPILLICVVTYLYAKGAKELRYYLLACCALFTATIIWATMSYTESFISPNLLFLGGTALDSLLFTLSIFDCIKIDLSEKDMIREREKYYIALSRTDALTGLYNRRYLGEIVKQLEANNEMPSDSALIMIDLDNFKAINDTYGHLIGDIILTRTGTKIKKHIRKSDIACRYGGDEFLVLLPGAKIDVAEKIAEEIRKDIVDDICYSETGEEVLTSISIGITEARLDDSFDGMFLRADAALYQAKTMGKNRTSFL